MSEKTARIYVCYSHDDVRFAKDLVDDLSSSFAGSIYIDFFNVEDPQKWGRRKQTLEAIKNADGTLICLSNAAANDSRVRREIALALGMEKHLFLVILEDCFASLVQYKETKEILKDEIIDLSADYKRGVRLLSKKIWETTYAQISSETKSKGINDFLLDPTMNFEDGQGKQIRRVVKDFLPRRLKHFVDRERESNQIESYLKQRESVLLQGLGGIGKTRLAAELAYRLRNEFSGGVLWLSSVDHPSTETLLNALAIAFQIDLGGMPLSQKKLLVKGDISDTDFLLVLDDIKDISPVLELMDIISQGTILCTGRPPWYIPSMKLVQMTVLAPNYATDLFKIIATRDFTALDLPIVDRICREKLNGYPLAIELAANQVRVQNIPVQALLKRIEHKALDSLDVPYLGSIRMPLLSTIDQLTESARDLFWHLGVFSGSTFSAEAAGYINQDTIHILDSLFQLSAFSLVQYEDDRFSMHPLLKQFAAENINIDAPYIRMVEYYIQYIAQKDTLSEKTDAEGANIVGSLDWCYANQRYDLFVELVDGLLGEDAYYSYWAVHGYWQDATAKLQEAISASLNISDEDRFAKYQLSFGLFSYWLGENDSARKAYSSAEKVFRKNGDKQSLIRIYWQLGYIEDDEDNYELASKLYSQSLTLAQEVGDKRLIGTSKELVAVVDYHKGNYKKARILLEEAIEESRAENDILGVTRSQRRLAAVARRQSATTEDLNQKAVFAAEARSLLTGCLKLERNKRSQARALRQLGMLDLLEGKPQDARRHLEAALTRFEQLGNQKGIAATLYNMGLLEELSDNLDVAEENYSRSLEIGRAVNVKMGIALNLRQLGMIAKKRDTNQKAEQLLKESIKILSEIESPYLEETQLMLTTLQ